MVPDRPAAAPGGQAAASARRPRRHDPDRRDRIIDVTIEVIAEHGLAGTSHRTVAEAADVPLGSMTYHFTGLDELVELAFSRYAGALADRFDARLAAAPADGDLAATVTDVIMVDFLQARRDLVLAYELYLAAARDPALREVTRTWMSRSRRALERLTDPATAQVLDALLEGLVLHNFLAEDPMTREEVHQAVARVVGPAG
ncbi:MULTISPECIES: TetR/AcrR family transcriptional regulator [Streptosporangium]|uniref:DNA-binding transcriptional regulator YbjK n=1 Tax=Streptosporangium brasiliense TaxID=47480 RepID=A0ABT9R971_9ACTN|nr:TetR family transcriptional regulator [Streptosporangium brasiliense]MDP9865688.1 DNA-binding transcriptional regulator YbjK [Streptosporangium brasiliense]